MDHLKRTEAGPPGTSGDVNGGLEEFAGEAHTALLESAASLRDYPTLSDLTPETVRQIAAAHGVDFATSLLYHRVRNDGRNRPYIARINRLRTGEAHTPAQARNELIVAIIPAAFYKEKPHSGADGRVIRNAAARLGLRSELVPVHSTGTLAQNSSILLDWLKQRAGQKAILVSLCKGGADVKFAFARPGAPEQLQHVLAWVNVCGTLNGSLIAAWLLKTKVRTVATWVVLKSGGHKLAFLRELVPSASNPLSGPIMLPPQMKLISIAGFPLRRHLSNGFMRRCHTVLSERGPNDGGLLLADVCQVPGAVYPVWGADHYLRPDDRAEQIIAAVLSDLIERPAPERIRNQEEPCPSH